MNDRRSWFGLTLVALLAAAATAGLVSPVATAQRARVEPRYEYKVVGLSYNPGDRLTDNARAAAFERLLNEYAREGWEPVADLLSRTNVHTVGGAVASRDTVSFVAFRRPR